MPGPKANPAISGCLFALLGLGVFSLATTAPAGWIDGPPLPEPRWHHAAAASNDGYVMAFGGRLYYGQGEERRYGHGLGSRALVFFDPHERRWEAASRMPPYVGRVMKHRTTKEAYERDKASGMSDPPIKDSPERTYNYELPFGGADALGRAHYFLWRGSVYFDPRSRTWGQAEAPVYHVNPRDAASRWVDGTRPSWESRSAGATATGPDGRMYLVGGMGDPIEKRGSAQELLNGLDIYDPKTNEWKRGTSMKIARQTFAAAFGGDGKLYVFGGCACRGSIPMYKVGDEAGKTRAAAEAMAQKKSVAETEVYDPKTDTWSMAAPMPTPRMLFAAATGVDGKIYTIGGVTWIDGDPTSLVEVYDPRSGRWSRGPSLRIARGAHTASTTGDGTIWVIGGVAGAPGLFDFSRRSAGDKAGATTSVELLKTTAR